MRDFTSEMVRSKKHSKNVASNFSRPITFDLQTQAPNKTVDIGRNGVSLSLDACGRILQASTFHPEHGIVVAVPFEQFDGSRFYDSSYVRSYRTRMLQFIKENKPGFGLNLGTNMKAVDIYIHRTNVACFDFNIDEMILVSLQVQVLDNGEICQAATVTNTGPSSRTLAHPFNLRISLNRASYGQLTEGGPIPLPESRNVLQTDGGRLVGVINPALVAQFSCTFEINGETVDVSGLANQEVQNTPLEVEIPRSILIGPNTTIKLRTRYMFSPHLQSHTFPPVPDHHSSKEESNLSHWKREDALTTYIIRRNVDYILANCVIPISKSSTCIITDHVALPLGWNRDNYWQVRLLLETHKHMDILLSTEGASQYAQQLHAATRGHLIWVFKAAQRPYGFWHRSYLVTGKPKDHSIFQLDQQCYPLLELCDFLEYFPDELVFVRELLESGVMDSILQLLESKRDPDTGLWPTDETPGDDAVIYPYHFSSHILLWRTLTRLRGLKSLTIPLLDDSVKKLGALADDLHARVLSSFTATHPASGQQLFAYLTDGHGNHTFYHDANDIPTLFASEWGFVSTPDELSIWRNTLDFAFSPLNTTGYCASGPYAGLGSVHSPGAWLLGYFQELAYATSRKDISRMQEVWQKIAGAMQWDGTFSEAVDSQTGECSSKAWFSWPGSMIGALIIMMRREGLENLLVE